MKAVDMRSLEVIVESRAMLDCPRGCPRIRTDQDLNPGLPVHVQYCVLGYMYSTVPTCIAFLSRRLQCLLMQEVASPRHYKLGRGCRVNTQQVVVGSSLPVGRIILP